MTTDLHIRNAVPADIELIEDMIAALCAFHDDTYQHNPNAIIRDVFGTQAGARVFFGERQGSAVVFALCYNEFGLHIGQRRLRVHLFYVDEAHRKTGAGRQMMQHLERLPPRRAPLHWCLVQICKTKPRSKPIYQWASRGENTAEHILSKCLKLSNRVGRLSLLHPKSRG